MINFNNKKMIKNSLELNVSSIEEIYPGFEYSTSFKLGPSRLREEAVMILQEIKRRNLPFPLSRYFLEEDFPHTGVQRLREYKPKWLDISHCDLKGQSCLWWLPTFFRDIPRHLVNRKNDWWHIDVVVDYFTEYERIRAKKEYSPAIIDLWNSDEEVLKLLIACSSKKVINCETLRRQLYFTGGRELSLFRSARCLGLLQAVLFNDFEGNTCEEFEGKRWLDISAGWGDRLFTACSLKMDYVGFDPNVNLKIGHTEIIETIGNHTKQCVHYNPFEKAITMIQEEVIRGGRFDICLTSPPFYIIERYNGPEQSTDNYKGFEDWMIHFLLSSLYIAWHFLKDGSYLAVNMANIRDRDIIGPMILCIEDYFEESVWEGIITFSGRSTVDTPGAVYCWRKMNHYDGERKWNPVQQRSMHLIFPKLQEMWSEKIKILDEQLKE